MKYHLFAHDSYYPSGGLGDYLGAFDTFHGAYLALDRGYDDVALAIINDEGALVDTGAILDTEYREVDGVREKAHGWRLQGGSFVVCKTEREAQS